jgi:hypothetical protein
MIADVNWHVKCGLSHIYYKQTYRPASSVETDDPQSLETLEYTTLTPEYSPWLLPIASPGYTLNTRCPCSFRYCRCINTNKNQLPEKFPVQLLHVVLIFKQINLLWVGHENICIEIRKINFGVLHSKQYFFLTSCSLFTFYEKQLFCWKHEAINCQLQPSDEWTTDFNQIAGLQPCGAWSAESGGYRPASSRRLTVPPGSECNPVRCSFL